MADRSIEFIARGLAVRGGRVLLCKNVKHGYYFLPGGHVEFGETAQAAIIREMKEEAGVIAKCEEVALVAEHIFERVKRPCHEVNVVFHVELPDEAIDSREPKIAFEWADFAQITDLDFRPGCIKAWLIAGGRISKPISWVSERVLHVEH